MVRHGFGYSIFDYTEDGITTELCVYVATDAPVKFYKLKIGNHSGRQRQLSATGFWELVLGDMRSKSLLHVVTEADPSSGAILARNVYSPEFGDRMAFVNCSETIRTFSGDRAEFLGRNGQFANPAAMQRARLSGRVGAGYDPCAAFQAPLTLADGQEKDHHLHPGRRAWDGRDEEPGPAIPRRGERQSRDREECGTIGVGPWAWCIWKRPTLPSIFSRMAGWSIRRWPAACGPARAFINLAERLDFAINCRMPWRWCMRDPQLLREHLLRAAARQFREGDVQHWWHPPVGRGVRTHFSDDYLWLPLAICRYVGITGDTGVLDERVPFLTSRPLRDDEESNYDLPHVSDDIGTLYEHGVRAIDRGLRFGQHGLPLMGCGDWNDGMNLVGQHGQGESVWLAFFLFNVLTQFADLARRRGDAALADRYAIEAGKLAREYRRSCLGRRVVPTSVFRRRHSAWLRHE